MKEQNFEIIDSLGGKPIKAWTKGVPVEEAAKQQLRNIAGLPFIHSHVAVMPDVHFGKGATVGSVIATKGAIVPAAVGVDIGCFVGSTKVPLLDGNHATLFELEQREEPFYVHSISNDLLRGTPGRARCVKTREDAELVKVTLSNGAEVVCTPDHEFMLVSGLYKVAAELTSSDALMTLPDDYSGEFPDVHAVQVEALEERADVYCLQVEVHHNFALSAGVFVHNCGMIAQETSLRASDLPDSLSAIRSDLERAIPHGFVTTPGRAVRGGWEVAPNSVITRYRELAERYDKIIEKHPKINHKSPLSQMGTLGGGNHFIELCLAEDSKVWLMLHSGSRGAGNLIGTYFIEKAKEEMARHYIHLPDKDLSYLVEGSELYEDYCEALSWAQDYAMANRLQMLELALGVLRKHLPPFTLAKHAVNAHHNYVAKEEHFGSEVMVTRKGAVRAREGDLGIIPGSMGTKSYIVRGKGNKQSFCSCSHGAGRVLSRGEAKRRFTVEDHIKATAGIECRKDEDVLDETPAAYKDIDAVMLAQADLVDVLHTLRQVLCVKG